MITQGLDFSFFQHFISWAIKLSFHFFLFFFLAFGTLEATRSSSKVTSFELAHLIHIQAFFIAQLV